MRERRKDRRTMVRKGGGRMDYGKEGRKEGRKM
jgi:hypothetical protein